MRLIAIDRIALFTGTLRVSLKLSPDRLRGLLPLALPLVHAVGGSCGSSDGGLGGAAFLGRTSLSLGIGRFLFPPLLRGLI
jgi:hypothetical protein